jgi:hypothetical protein
MSLVKMLTEERKDLSVKHLVEGHTIEAWRIDADVRIALHLTGCAWCKKFKASSVAGINIVPSSLLFNLRPRLGELTLAAGIPDIAQRSGRLHPHHRVRMPRPARGH